MSGQFIYRLSGELLPPSVGNKAEQLRKVHEMGGNVPVTYCCTWEAYTTFQEHGDQVAQQLREELSAVIDPDKSYAVRSSTDLEDGQESSFAGQFTTILDVKGLEAILHAIQEVWQSGRLEGLRSYQARVQGDGSSPPRMAVLVQEMVSPLLSGVVFSKNPITGLAETVIEAVEGPGSALVQDGVTPLRWVYKWGRWLEQPAGAEALTATIQDVVAQTGNIVREYGKGLDLEWVFDGQLIYWVQLREITALEDIRIYSNKISKEFLPGMIKPLVWSVNVPLVNGAWVRLLTEVIGKYDISPRELARSFYYRAYFDVSEFEKIFDMLGLPRQSLEIHMGIVEPPDDKPSFRPNRKMVRLVPRLLGFVRSKWDFAKEVQEDFPVIASRLQAFAEAPTADLNQEELLEKIDQLFGVVQTAAYYNIVVPLLMYAYNGALRNQLKKLEVGIEEVDFTATSESYDAYAPDISLERLSIKFSSLSLDMQEFVRQSDYQSFQQISGIEVFQADVKRFIEQFGHLSDSGNDFSVPPWREDPDSILRLISSYEPNEGKKSAKLKLDDLPVQLPRRWLVNFLYHRARSFRHYREWVSSVYTFGYGLFRDYYLALGTRLVEEGLLADGEDIFYLYDEEIRRVVAGDTGKEAVGELVSRRKREMQEYLDVELPDVIYGDEPPAFVAAPAAKLRGTPTSRGVYTGRAKIVRGLVDFTKVNEGDVLVIPYSDVGWTPLFSKAGAVVAESGGILSHSSIVAREYGMPAVVSVSGACAIEDDTVVTVDGHLGEIFIHELEVDEEEELGDTR